MDKKTSLCLFYIALLVLPAPILAEVKAEKERDRRQAIALPLASLAGTSVAAPVFAALLAIYGAYTLAKYGIRVLSDKDSHPCGRGYCRKTCQKHERIDWGLTTGCGNYYCCV
ncbi:big defensin-like [Saccostrea echinata]|uniref:big defensin-like n=1 Tax=Saccostrea echinata TaxID=191078 RepID=UPI002A826F04|nr:big defensin-like [Saccostrea echinata]